MVIHDLNIFGSGLGPAEADPILIVDADAVLAVPVPFQRLEAVARWGTEIPEIFRLIQLIELSVGYAPQLRGTGFRSAP